MTKLFAVLVIALLASVFVLFAVPADSMDAHKCNGVSIIGGNADGSAWQFCP